jgi:N-dimethylarginine dimethylaminohydrolase
VVDHGVAIYDPASFPYNIATYLEKEKGMELIEIPREECLNHACNTVLLEPGKVLIPDGNPETVRLLESRDIEPVIVPMNEFKIAGGTVHCSVGRLRREDGPLLSDLPDGPDPADVEHGPTLVESL